jgi:hypothetical protein
MAFRPRHRAFRHPSFGMTAHPVCPGGCSMTFRRIAVFWCSHASHPCLSPSSTRISRMRGND